MKATKAATLKAKNGRLAGKRALRAQEEGTARALREAKRAQEARAAEPKVLRAPPRQASVEDDDVSWEQVEDQVEKEAKYQKAKAQVSAAAAKKAPQNKPTASTARDMWNDSIDERLVSDAEIKGRWDKSLLSGGRGGSVSLAQKKEREKNDAARSHKVTRALCDEADHMVKAALTGSNRTFSAMAVDELIDSGFVGTEAKSQARTNRFLEVIDGDVAEQYLLDEGEAHLGSLPMGLDQIAFKEK